MMRRFFSFILTGILLAGFASVTWGAGVFGWTDLMYTPTPATLKPGVLGLGVNFHEGSLSFFNFDFGVTQNMEFGVAAFNYPSSYSYPSDTEVTLRGKYQVLHENKSNLGLAVGIEDLGRDDISPYVTLTKGFDEGMRGYLGVGGGSFDGLFGGFSKTFSLAKSSSADQLSQVQLFLEADSIGLNIGTKLQLGATTRINFGLEDMDRWVMGVTFLIK